MYAKVEKSRYQKVTGNARAAILSGRFIASVAAQLLVSFEVMNLRELNFLTLGGELNPKHLSSYNYLNKFQLKGCRFSLVFCYHPLASAFISTQCLKLLKTTANRIMITRRT